MGARSFGFACASTAALFALSDDARADEPIAIAWEAPAGCPDAAAVRADVDRLLGGAPKEGRAPLAIEGRVEGKGRAMRLTLRMRGGGAEAARKLDATSCSTLSEAGALLIALAFDPDAVAAASAAPAATTATTTTTTTTTTTATTTTTPTTTTPTTPTTTPTTTTRRTTTPTPRRASGTRGGAAGQGDRSPPGRGAYGKERRPFGWGATAAFVGDAGSLPALAPGFRAGVVVVLRAYEIHASFEGWPQSDAASVAHPSQGARFSLFAGQIRGCRLLLPWRAIESPVTLTGCLDLEAGRIAGTGFGVTRPASGDAPWFAPGTSFDLRLDLSRPVGFLAAVGIAVPVDRRSFVIETPDRDVLHTPAPVSARFGLAADVRF